jgi:hypothetical protein
MTEVVMRGLDPRIHGWCAIGWFFREGLFFAARQFAIRRRC